MGTGERVGAPARGAEHPEPVEPEDVRRLCDVSRPVEDPPAGLEVREAVSRPVERDDADARVRRGSRREAGLEPGAGVAVEVEPGLAVGRPVLREAEEPPVAERQRLRLAGHRDSLTA